MTLSLGHQSHLYTANMNGCAELQLNGRSHMVDMAEFSGSMDLAQEQVLLVVCSTQVQLHVSLILSSHSWFAVHCKSMRPPSLVDFFSIGLAFWQRWTSRLCRGTECLQVRLAAFVTGWKVGRPLCFLAPATQCARWATRTALTSASKPACSILQHPQMQLAVVWFCTDSI